MLKVAIIGCGRIADAHVAQIRRLRGCEIVGVCDREPLMARQLAERFAVERSYSDVEELLNDARPDVVHITTPPQSHFKLGQLLLDSGCHVYIEKPFALSEAEAVRLVSLAEDKGLRITAGHDDQFSHVARRLRALVESGFLGGPAVHMESYYGYEIGRGGYAGAVLADKNHWVRRLPGGLLHNIISHGIARIAEFLAAESPLVVAHGFVSPILRSFGERDIIDELRVIISDGGRTTAYFTFSSQIRPCLHEFRIFGPKNGLLLDQDQETLIRLYGKRLPSYSEKFIPPIRFAGQYLGNWRGNLRRFLRNDFHMKSGLKYLIETFYKSITEGTPVPIPYREIVLTARIMDHIFEQLAARTGELTSVLGTAEMVR